MPLAEKLKVALPCFQVPYKAGSGVYPTNAGTGIATCTNPTVAAGSSPIGWTTVSPPNDIGLAAALLNTPIKVGARAALGAGISPAS